MRRFRQIALAIVLGGGGGFACGEANAPAAPESLVAAGGNGQTGPAGAMLGNPLIVLATGSDGRPFPNATVHWAVTTGSATPGAATSVTDSAGIASTTLTLGTQAGPVAVRASVSGTPPVTFTATAVDPCDWVEPYTFGTPGQAALSSVDCVVPGGYFTDFHQLEIASPQGTRLVMSSPAFDTWLELYRVDGPLMAYNDDRDTTTTDSQVDIILAPGQYIIAPSSFTAGQTGAYSFSATARPQAITNCDFVWATRGVTIADTITATDCADSAGTSHADALAIIALSGSVLTIVERSSVVNPLLELYWFSGDSLVFAASNDDSSAGNTNAFLAYPVATSAIYLIFAGSASAGETGAYTLAISASTTAAGAQGAAAERGFGRLDRRTWRSRLTRRPSGR